MKAMTILIRCREAKRDIEQLQRRIDQRHDVLTSLSAPQADPNGGSRGSGDKDKIGRIYAEIDALERELDVRRDAEKAESAAALSLVDLVPELEGKILFDYYVKRWDTAQISRKEKYTAGYVRKTKRNAEQLLDMISPERVDSVLPAWYLKTKGGE